MLIFDTAETQAFWRQACEATGIDPATTHHAGTFAEPSSDDDVPFLDELAGRCQGKANRYPKVVMHPPSGRKLAPLGEGGGTIELEILAGVEVSFLVEVVVKRGMNGGKLL